MSISTITINAVDYTAYASVAEANAYLAVDPTRATTWATLNDDQKGANLVAATRRMDLLDYSGTKVSSTQENEWPRTGATCNGTAVTETDVPIELQNATILKAGSIALDPTNGNAGTSGSNVSRVRAGTAEVEFFRPQAGVAVQDETAFELVRCLLAGAGMAGGYGCAFGTDGTTSFGDVNAPDFSEGYP